MGDPAGTGPELCLRLLADATIQQTCVPIVFGDAALIFETDAPTAQP